MSEIVDDKSEHCIPFILERLKLHREHYESRSEQPPPFFVGANGCQGSGKTTLVGEHIYCCSSIVQCFIFHSVISAFAMMSFVEKNFQTDSSKNRISRSHILFLLLLDILIDAKIDLCLELCRLQSAHRSPVTG